MLKVQVEGKIKQVWHYFQDLQLHPCYDLIHTELSDQKFTHKYIQIMCYLKQVTDQKEDKTVYLKTKDGQTVIIPLKDAVAGRFGDQVLIAGMPIELGENR